MALVVCDLIVYHSMGFVVMIILFIKQIAPKLSSFWNPGGRQKGLIK